MCTLIILNQVVSGLPVVLAANRDEFYAREAKPAHHLGDGIWAGVDAEAGGTWLGVTERGFFAALTNHRGSGPDARAPRSRGHVVMDLLRAGRVGSAIDVLVGVAPGDFNGFNAMFGDAERSLVAYARPGARRVEIDEVAPGVHVLPSDLLDAPSFPKVERAQRAVEALLGTADAWPTLASGLANLLADHTELLLADTPPAPGARLPTEVERKLHALCVHTPFYGTRSASLIALSAQGLEHYEFADGAPCTVPFAPVFEPGQRAIP
jgi:uncharacterized protein with NRDE domain